jgi:hypothetical protein
MGITNLLRKPVYLKKKEKRKRKDLDKANTEFRWFKFYLKQIYYFMLLDK